MVANSVYCEVLHSEAIRRKCDCTHQDVLFFRRRFVAFGRKKKVKKKPMPYTHQDVISFRRHFTAFDGKKGDTGAAALYGGKRKRTV